MPPRFDLRRRGDLWRDSGPGRPSRRVGGVAVDDAGGARRVGGPARAIDAFLRGGDTCYVRDRRPEYYYITQHWGGYLYKKRRCGAAGAAETLE